MSRTAYTSYQEESTRKIAAIEQILQQQALMLKNQSLIDLFMHDGFRAQNFSTQWQDYTFDYSKNFITEKVMQHLIQFAHEKKLQQKIQAMFSGARINTTENRAVLHTALRRPLEKPLVVEGTDIMVAIAKAQSQCREWIIRLQSGYRGVTNKPIQDIVHIGIGGSDLGPKLVTQALKAHQRSALRLHFVANIDPEPAESLLNTLNPETTMVIVSSKSFSTRETLSNAAIAKQWLSNRLGTKASHHLMAITANAAKAQDFGILESHILLFWEWVGGRYSIWSNIGFPLALQIGFDQYQQFLRGAYEMDQHFINASWRHNLPVLMALIGHWYIQYWEASTLAVLPYAEGLSQLPNYLQQLDMESNGKHCQANGLPCDYKTGPVVWGQAGTHGQHAFYQLLHQGTHFIPCDIIGVVQTQAHNKQAHQELLANAIAQSQALMLGNTHENITRKQNIIEGNHPSNVLLLKKLTPHNLGALLALYEHKVFTQGVLWGVNSFDQPGVELGKVLANNVLQRLQGKSASDTIDPSTQFLVQCVRQSV